MGVLSAAGCRSAYGRGRTSPDAPRRLLASSRGRNRSACSEVMLQSSRSRQLATTSAFAALSSALGTMLPATEVVLLGVGGAPPRRIRALLSNGGDERAVVRRGTEGCPDAVEVTARSPHVTRQCGPDDGDLCGEPRRPEPRASARAVFPHTLVVPDWPLPNLTASRSCASAALLRTRRVRAAERAVAGGPASACPVGMTKATPSSLPLRSMCCGAMTCNRSAARPVDGGWVSEAQPSRTAASRARSVSVSATGNWWLRARCSRGLFPVRCATGSDRLLSRSLLSGCR